MSAERFPTSRRNKVLRAASLASYDRRQIADIIDAAMVCHVGYVIEGQPYVIPTLHARDGDTILLHGHAKARTLLHAGSGHPVCIAITHTDGIVLARSIFNHSINYRSVTLYGSGRLITEREEKYAALRLFSEKLLPGRWDDVRPMTEQELTATAIIAVPIDSASAKISDGFPEDPDEDLEWPTWAGVIPMREVYDDPIADQHTPPDQVLPAYLADLLRNKRG